MTFLKRTWFFLAIVLLFIYPLAGIIVAIPTFADRRFGLSSFLDNSDLRKWLVVWLPFFLFVLVSLIFHRDWYGIFSHGIQVIFATLLFLVFRSMHKALSKQFIATALVTVLAIMAIAGISERLLGTRIWLNNNTNLVEVLSSSLKKEQTLVFPNDFYRVWQMSPDTDTIKLNWKAKLVSGTLNWDWESQTQKGNLSIVSDGSKSYTHFEPTGANPFIYKSLAQASSIAGYSVQAIINLRSSSLSENCGVLSLAERGATNRTSTEICTNKSWQPYTIEWQVPMETTKKNLTFVINRFNSPLDIGQLQLKIKAPYSSKWQTINALAPNGASLRLIWQNAWLEDLLLEERFLPTSQWQDYSLELKATSLKDAGQLTAIITGERGLKVAIKETTINSNETIKAVAGQNLRRLQLWFQHPNLMGHATVAITLSALVLSQAVITNILIIIVGIFLTILSGSRAAMLALGVGILLSIFFKLSKNTLKTKRLILVASLIIVPAILIVSVTQFEAFRRLAFGVGRTDIWSVAWQAIQGSPLFGIGFGNFSDFFATLRPDRATVNHAHNLALVYLSNYGLFGGLALGWLIGAWLFFIAHNRNIVNIGILVVPFACIIFANIFDFSFFNAVVITALIANLSFETRT